MDNQQYNPFRLLNILRFDIIYPLLFFFERYPATMQSVKLLRNISRHAVVSRAPAVKIGCYRAFASVTVVRNIAVPRLSAIHFPARFLSFSTELPAEDLPVFMADSKLVVKTGQPFTGHAEVKLVKGIYSGDFVEGKRHGHGVCKFEDGFVYSGEWKDNHRNGNGIVTDISGAVVVQGLFKNGKLFTGTGHLETRTGGNYKGEVLEGQRHGQGKLTTKTGQVWEGEFRHSKPFNGKGWYDNKQGVWVEGAFTADNNTLVTGSV